jgi:hypothetical protein
MIVPVALSMSCAMEAAPSGGSGIGETDQAAKAGARLTRYLMNVCTRWSWSVAGTSCAEWSFDRLYTTCPNCESYTGAFEGDLGFCATDGTAPLFRLYSQASTDHYYTASSYEMSVARDNYHYTLESSNYCGVFTTQVPGTCPVYRLYHGGAEHSDHLMTMSANERNSAVWNNGYVYDAPGSESIAFYMIPPNGSCPP